MSLSTTFSDFASTAKDYFASNAQAAKQYGQMLYGEMTVANARNVLSAAKNYGINAYNSMTVENAEAVLNQAGVIFTEYKGRYIELFNNNQNFAIANCVAVNLIAFSFFNKVANKIEQIPCHRGRTFIRLCVKAAFGFAIYQINVVFCRSTGFVMTLNTMRAIALGAVVIRVILKRRERAWADIWATFARFDNDLQAAISVLQVAKGNSYTSLSERLSHYATRLSDLDCHKANQSEVSPLETKVDSLKTEISLITKFATSEFKKLEDAIAASEKSNNEELKGKVAALETQINALQKQLTELRLSAVEAGLHKADIYS